MIVLLNKNIKINNTIYIKKTGRVVKWREVRLMTYDTSNILVVGIAKYTVIIQSLVLSRRYILYF